MFSVIAGKLQANWYQITQFPRSKAIAGRKDAKFSDCDRWRAKHWNMAIFLYRAPYLPSLKLTYPLRLHGWKMKCHVGMPYIFSFREGRPLLSWLSDSFEWNISRHLNHSSTHHKAMSQEPIPHPPTPWQSQLIPTDRRQGSPLDLGVTPAPDWNIWSATREWPDDGEDDVFFLVRDYHENPQPSFLGVKNAIFPGD